MSRLKERIVKDHKKFKMHHLGDAPLSTREQDDVRSTSRRRKRSSNKYEDSHGDGRSVSSRKSKKDKKKKKKKDKK